MNASRRVSRDNVDHLRRLIGESDIKPGRVVNQRYEVLRRVAQGGMGEIFCAQDLRLDRPVALKVLAIPGPQWSTRFSAEIRAMTQLEHPGIVPVHDSDLSPNGQFYYVMKYVSGRTLEEMIAREEPRDVLLAVLIKAGEIVQYAHEQGVIHRDLKPSNIMVDTNGTVFVMDWGIARLMDEIRQAEGAVLGTVEYMSPEQARGDTAQVDERSDVYALGAMLYEILAGRPPVQGTTPRERLSRARAGSPTSPRNVVPSVPSELEAICRRALQPRPGLRYRSTAAFADDLRRYRQGEPVAAYPSKVTYRFRKRLVKNRALLLAAAIGLAAASMVAWFMARQTLQHQEVAARQTLRRQEEDLRELMGLWHKVIVAKQDWYLAHKDPRKTRDNIQAAVEGLTRYLERYPDAPQAYYARARGKLYLEDLSGAQRDVEEAVRREPGFSPGWALLGWVKIEKYIRSLWGRPDTRSERMKKIDGLRDEAQEAFRRAAREGGRRQWGLDTMEEEDVAANLTLAIAKYYEGDHAEACRMVEAAHRRSPHEEYCRILGHMVRATADKIRWETEALRIRPHFAMAYFGRGAQRIYLKDGAGVIEDCTKGLEIYSGFAWGYIIRAMGRGLNQDPAGAVEDATQALRLDPDSSNAFGVRASAKLELKDLAGAIEDASQALKLEPRNPETLIVRALAKAFSGDFRGTREDAESALALDARSCYATSARAIAREGIGDVEGAIQDATKAIELDPLHGAAYMTRARCRARKSDLPGAVQDASKTLELDPRAFQAYALRADVRKHLGFLREALEDYTQALNIQPNHVHAVANRARTLERLARKDPENASSLLRRAEEDFRRALDLAGPGQDRGPLEAGLERVREALLRPSGE